MAYHQPSDLGRRLLWAKVLAIVLAIWYLMVAIVMSSHRTISYMDSGWLVTYSGGFVRRGLLGTCILATATWTHIGPLTLMFWAKVALTLAFLLLITFVLLRHEKALGVKGVLLVMTAPVICFFAQQLGIIDLAFILITVVNQILATNLSQQKYRIVILMLMATIGVAISLSHEAFLFLGIPLNVIICARKLAGLPRWWLPAIYAGPILACLAALKFSGTLEQANAISDAWSPYGIVLPCGPGASVISYFGQSESREVMYQLKEVTARWRGDILFLLSSTLSALPILTIILSMDWDRRARRNLMRDYVLTPLMCTLPLFLWGADWDRWVACPLSAGLLSLVCAEAVADHLLVRKKHVVPCLAFAVLGAFIIPASPGLLDPRPSAMFFGFAETSRVLGKLNHPLEWPSPELRLPIPKKNAVP